MRTYLKTLFRVYRSYLGRVSALVLLRNYLLLFSTVFIATLLLPSLSASGIYGIASFSLLMIFANIFVIPIINLVLMPITIRTFGVFSILLNLVILAGLLSINSGVTFEGGIGKLLFFNIIFIAILSILSSIISSTPVDNFELMFLKSVTENPEKKNTQSSLFFLEIDGLSEEVLEYGMENGYADTLKSWFNKTHKLIGWESDISSQTSASQAGILHGDNSMIPAFRWFDRKQQKIVTSNNFDDAKFIQKSLSDGKGILANNGVSFNNMFDGDSPESSLNISDLGSYDERKRAMKLYFAYPQAFMRSITFAFFEIGIEIKDAIAQKLSNVEPRIHRKPSYMIARGVTNVILRDLAVYRVIDAMLHGVPILYTTFVGYDEVAHHAGIKDKSTMNTLRRLDDQFKKIEYMSRYIDGQQHFIVLSDHGQSQGWTFLQRYGYTLEDLVKKYFVGVSTALSDELSEEHSNDLKENLDKLLKREKKAEPGKREPGEVITLASGNKGLIFFTGYDHRLTDSEIENIAPGLLKELENHEGIQFISYRTNEGTILRNGKGSRNLQTSMVVGKDPLAPYESKHILDHFKKYESGPNVPDIMVMSMFNKETGEVAAFEELVGCHGGIGGPQSFPFILYPKFLSQPKSDLVGAGDVYKQIKIWSEEYFELQSEKE